MGYCGRKDRFNEPLMTSGMGGFLSQVIESAARASPDDRFPWRVQARRSEEDLPNLVTREA